MSEKKPQHHQKQPPTKLPPIEPVDKAPVKISAERREQLTESLFHASIERKKKAMQELEAKIYRTEDPKVISKQQLEASVVRQHDDEMSRRKKKMVELEQKVHPAQESKKLSHSEIDESVRRIYDDQVRIKKERLEKARQAVEKQHKNESKQSTRTVTKDEVAACGARLCKPKKRDLTDDEINAILFK